MGLCFSGSLPVYFLLFAVIVSLFYLANKFSLSLSLSLIVSFRHVSTASSDGLMLSHR